MHAPSLTIDSIHSDVITRTANTVAVALHVHFEKPVREDKSLSVRFRLVKDTALARTTVSGIILFTSDNEEELDDLMKQFSDPKKPPLGIVEYIVLRLQPLILHIEDYMGIPPIPVAVLHCQKKDDRQSGFMLYQ